MPVETISMVFKPIACALGCSDYRETINKKQEAYWLEYFGTFPPEPLQ